MSHWPIKPLGEVIEVSRERIEPTDYPDMLFNYIGLESIEVHTGRLLPYQPTLGAEIKSTKNIFRQDEILYGKLRPYLNKVYLAREEGICSTDIYVLRPIQQNVNPSFISYYLRSPSVLAVASSSMAGANLPRISQEALLSIPVPVPPLAEQERIVQILDEADELRKLRAQADRRTADLIPALFHEMFGDPATNPKGWSSHKLPDICNHKEGIKAGPFGSSLKKDCYTTEGPRIYGQEQVIAGNFSVGDYHISEEKFAEMSAYVVAPGDLLISLVGTIG